MKYPFGGADKQAKPPENKTMSDKSRDKDKGGAKSESREGSETGAKFGGKPKSGVAFPTHRPFGSHDGITDKAFEPGCE